MNCRRKQERMKLIYTIKPAIVVGQGKAQQRIEMELI